MSNPSQHNTRPNKQQNEEDAEAGSVLSPVKVPPPTDTLVLLTQALTSLLVNTEERRKEENERREFEDARLRQWESTEKDRQARLEYLETANAGREAAARKAQAMVAETREAQRQADLSSRKKQSILQTPPKLDDQTDPEAFLATFEAAMKEGNFQNKERTLGITDREGVVNLSRDECHNGNAVPGIQDLAPRKTWLHRDKYLKHSLAQ